MSVDFIHKLWAWTQVFLFAAAPIGELRAAIPYGISILHLGKMETFIISIIGNFLPMYFIIILLTPITNFLLHHVPWLHKHVEKYYQKIHKRHSEKFNKLGYIALATFVAIPVPGTGAWTGALIAWLLALPLIPSLISLFFGILGSGIIVTFFWSTFLVIYRSIIG